jgi:hypothetical protein
VSDDDAEAAEAEILRRRYEAGERGVLLLTILSAAMFRRLIPDWAAEALKAAYERVECGDARSWDDVFGRPHPEKKHLRSIQWENRKYEVWRIVRWFHENEGRCIDNELFEDVGRYFGDVDRMMGRNTATISRTTISKLYYEAKDALDRVELRVHVSEPKRPRGAKKLRTKKPRTKKSLPRK